MSYYSYQAVDTGGKTVKGTLEAENPQAARFDIEAKGLYVINVCQSGQFLGFLEKKFHSGRVKRTDVIEFANNLSVMLGAGLPILVAIGDIIATSENKSLRNALFEIKQNIEMGTRFSEAIDKHQEIFPDIFVRLVRVGEETGRFESSLADIADHLQKMEDLAAAIKRALIYPIFAIITTFGALVFWMGFVLPKIIDTMKGMGVKLPLLTRILIVCSQMTQRYWYVIPLVPVVSFLVITLLKRKSSTRFYLDLLKLKLPVMKMVVYNKHIALFAEQMRILIVAGLTIDRTFDLIADVIGNEVFKRALLRAKETIMYGSLISDALKAEKLFPLVVIRMVNIGETSGTLDEQFNFLSEHYRKKLDDISDKLGKIIEPLVIATVGILFALIIIGLMLPIYDLVSSMGKNNP